MANIAQTTIALYPPEPDPHVIRLRRLDQISDFLVTATISVNGYGSLRAGATFHASPVIAVGATPRLNTRQTLAASATVSVGSGTTHLPLTNPLRATSAVRVGVVAPLTIIPVLQAAAPTIRLSTAPPRLSTGSAALRAQPRVQLRTNGPFLSRTKQFFTAQSSLRVFSNADLRLVGQSATDVFITFNGIPTFNVRLNSISITDELNEAPNICRFIVDRRIGQPDGPSVGTDVRIGLRDAAVNNLLFAGTVKTVTPYYERSPTNAAWDVLCEDYTFLLNRRRVFGTWTNVSATTVALEILSRFTAGFSTAGIASNLAPVTVTFRGETVMDALTQIATLIGGYAGGPDYNRVVWLFITDPRLGPDPVTATQHLLMLDPPVRQELDLSQVRTRVAVQGASTTVGGPPEFSIDNRYGQLPLSESHLFVPGQSGQVITADAQILTYADCVPGQLATTVIGNVPAPPSGPFPVLAPDTAGDLVGRYRWKISFGNAQGETPVGPFGSELVCPAFPSPTALAASPQPNQLGPLVGSYQYAVSFVTSRGETLATVSPPVSASPTAPPPSLSVGEVGASGAHAGRLVTGATYAYAVSYTTTYGETAPLSGVLFTPSSLPSPSLSNFNQLDFGGLQGGSDYAYGVTSVTAYGETAPPVWWTLHTFNGAGWPGTPGVSFVDFAGRVELTTGHEWACTYYNDQFGESVLGPHFIQDPSGTPPPGATGNRFQIFIPALSARADGIRVYRGLRVVNQSNLLMANADFRRGNVPGSYFDVLSQGECGAPWPVHQLRGGGIAVQFTISASPAPDTIARRLYRSKANNTGELYLLAEIQHNATTTYLDTAFDTALTARNPVVQTTGRQAVLVLPTPPFPSGYTGRRVYRSKANVTSVYYRLADVRDLTTTTMVDTTPDDGLTGDAPASPSTAGGQAMFLQSIPRGPTSVLARRIYRTVNGGSELRLLVEIPNNTTVTYLDTTADGDLGHTLAPLVGTAGASAVLLQSVPLGGPGVTVRNIYRTKAISPTGTGSEAYYYVGSIPNNLDQSFVDTKADDELGRPPQATSTIGALAGDTSLRVSSAAGWPASGWCEADSQVIRYSGISLESGGTATLTGIPALLPVTAITRSGATATATTSSAHGFTKGQRVVVLGADQSEYTGSRTVTDVPSPTTFAYAVSGTPATPATGTILTSTPGAITGAIAGGTTVISVPMLTGISGLGTPVPVGSAINLWVVRDSLDGQSALQALEGGDGVHEFIVTDNTLASVAACAARGDAELLAFQYVGVSITYTTRDRKTRSGALVSINLPTPQINGSYRIQSVRIDQIDIAARLYPRYSVTCGSNLFTVNDLWRHVVLASSAA